MSSMFDKRNLKKDIMDAGSSDNDDDEGIGEQNLSVFG